MSSAAKQLASLISTERPGWGVAEWDDCFLVSDENGEIKFVALLDVRAHERSRYKQQTYPLLDIELAKALSLEMECPIILFVVWKDGWGTARMDGTEPCLMMASRLGSELHVKIPIGKFKVRPPPGEEEPGGAPGVAPPVAESQRKGV